MIYRTVTKLAMGKTTLEPGRIIMGDKFSADTRDALLRRGAICEVSTPPVSVLPELQLMAKKLARIGIINVAQLIEGDAYAIALELRVARSKVVQYQQQAERWLTVSPPKSG